MKYKLFWVPTENGCNKLVLNMDRIESVHFLSNDKNEQELLITMGSGSRFKTQNEGQFKDCELEWMKKTIPGEKI